MPLLAASSTIYWIAGLSTIGSISLGMAFDAGSTRVPKPAAGITAFLIFISRLLYIVISVMVSTDTIIETAIVTAAATTTAILLGPPLARSLML